MKQTNNTNKQTYKKTNILFLLLLSTMLIFSGCGDPIDCSDSDTDYLKYNLDEETDECVVYKEIEENECGNGVAEADNDETFCNCPKDVKKTHPVLGCDGELGDYLEKSCSAEKTCELTQNKKVISQEKSIDFKHADSTFRADFKINTPFILNTDDSNSIKLDLSYFKGPTSTSIKVKDMIVKEVTLESSKGITYGTQTYNERVNVLGQKLQSKEFHLSETRTYESKESLKANLVISYTKEIYSYTGEVTKSEAKIEEITVSLGSWTIINPNFYEKSED